MATRLERLWVLLDSGSTPVTRKAAAVQIGEIQKLHPHELKNLLKKVSGYLNSKSWDTRIAAGQAVEAIASNVKQWEPGFQTKSESPTEAEGEEEDSSKEPEYLTFDTFDIKKVLEHGTPLLSSTGDEFQGLESDPDFQKLTPQERLALQRKQLEQRLGLSAQGKMFSVGMEHLFEDSDLMTSPLPSPGVCQETKRGTVKELSALQLSGLSAREKNLAKRKAKLNARRASVDTESKGKSECDSPPHKKLKTVSVVVEQGKAADKILIDQVTNAESAYDESMEWPFTLFCEELFHNLFNPSWEVRHGAATALREVVKAHGHTAGITGRMPPHSRPAVNQKWLADAAIRVLCVFSLDRFADFVSDQVVAPVRATCAQVLGVVSRLMTEENIVLTTRVLLLLAGQGQWEVRHASLMGIQHLLAARTDLCPLLLPSLYPSVLRGLQDSDDDVRAIAAASLLPVSSHLTSLLTQQVPGLLSVLWDSLLYLDDLSASTNSIMELMGTLLSFNYSSSSDSLSHTSSVTLEKLVPRLWPFLGHNISSVRKSSLQAIMTLLTLDEVEAASSSGDASDPVPSGGGGSNEGKAWLVQLLQPFLCQIFQRFLLEGDQQNRKLLQDVWSSIISQSSAARLQAHVSPLMWSWLCLLVASSSSPVDTNLLVPSVPGGLVSSCLYLGGGTGVESVSEKDQMALLARLAGTRALGVLAHKLSAHTQSANGTTPTTGVPSQPVSQDALSSLVAGLKRLLSSGVSLHRIVSVLVICHWQDCPHQDTLGPALLSALTDTTGLEDMLPYIVAMQRDCQSLIMALERHGQEVVKDVPFSSYNAEFATKLASTTYQNAMASLEVGVADRQELEACQRSLVGSISRLQEEHQRVTTRVSVCVSGALVSLQLLPDKLTPMIRPLMDCIKTEADPLIQELAAKWLSQLVGLCRNRKPSPMSKIIKNLCLFACCDPHCTPGMLPPEDRAGSTLSHRKGKTSKSGGPLESQGGARDGGSPPIEADWRENSAWKWNSGIISLVRLKRDGAFSKLPAPSRGRPSTAMKETMATALAMENQRKAMSCQRRGAEMALVQLSQHFKESLFKTVPNLWAHIHSPLTELPESPANVEEEDGSNPEESVASQVQVIVSSLHILEVIAPVLTTPNVPQTLLPLILPALYSPFTSIRHMAARGVACLCDMDLHFTMEHVVTEVLPWLGASSSLPHRQGAIEAVHCVLERLGLRGLVYVVLLLMPVLGTMSDQDNKVRLMASRVFAELVTLMPLESGAVTPPEMSASLAGKRDSDRHFIEQLLDTSKLDSYVVPVAIKADLRKYQQDGINWLAFLNRYKLHGILCDDMGLGKTLQSLCMIAGDHHIRTQAFKETSQVDSQPLPSLVVCPPTLTGHWVYEVRKFCELKDLDPLQYTGPPSVRARLQQQVLDHDLVVASYDIVRNDIDFFKTVHWNYCVLDEGHIIKNTRTQITRAIKQLKANHRLILSGTPIQNNVLELWSLFDFLMPGFLGTEKQFYEKFGRPIIMSRDAKSSSREQEAGALAMESLHRQVLPFLLRRMKEDVLQDLPPKIIQDYYCELSPLQVKLYEDFAKTQAKKKVEKDLVEGGDTMEEEEEATGDFTHIFQALQYLRKVCNHPALVVKPEHPMYSKVQDFLLKDSSVITDIKHAAKLQALRQLLLDCNIGDRPGGSEDAEGVACLSAVSQHRALIFCQYKSMLDIIEQDLLKAHMPSVTYLRLDGSVASWSRFGIVNKFNSDPSVDVLLLTTHVGGLGLNLTGADTVIFFEHDWNPMKDLQAMDRAHRIGQKKVVNVYRLITKGTLEEKIMSLQKFKLNIANTVISQDNSSLQAMNTSDLLDLFQISGTSNHRGNKKGEAKEGGANRSSGGMKKILENLPELWDDKQYTDEYDLSGFMKTLKDTH